MHINWKVRLKHRQFWIALISALMLLSNHVAALFNIDITVISAKIQQTLESILLILALFGIIIDPTTEGFKDSAQAMNYSEPKQTCEQRKEEQKEK
ncbi:phage holin [Lysinibacillus yapensis]|uniref:Phage holin n=2 Tax=Ureibacillus yapensis TaxID=2304605 RepID=A0A396SBN5_9BACL|nr:phage holin [Lysinibacillus yapensis]